MPVSSMRTAADQLATRAHAAVRRVPVRTRDEMVELMLANIRATWQDFEADVIAALQRKAGEE